MWLLFSLLPSPLFSSPLHRLYFCSRQFTLAVSMTTNRNFPSHLMRVHFTASASKTAPASHVTNCLCHALVLQPPFLGKKKEYTLFLPSPLQPMSLSLSSELQPASFFKASRWPRGHACHVESQSLISQSLLWYYGWVEMSPMYGVIRAENDVCNCTERLRMYRVPAAVRV